MYKSELGPPLYDVNGYFLGYASHRVLSKPESHKRRRPKDLSIRTSTDRTVYSSLNVRAKYPLFTGYDGKVYEGLLTCSHEWSLNSYVVGAARGKLLDAIKNQKANLAMMMAEYRQAASLFENLAVQLSTGYRDLRRGRFKKIKRGIRRNREFSKKWIEYQFGIAPLVSDLVGVCDSLASKLRDGDLQYITVHASDQGTYKRKYSNPNGPGLLYHFEREVIRVKLQAQFRISSQNIDDLRRFGFTNPAALAWELIPFSFVVDYVFSVGDWINRLDALWGISDFCYIQGTKVVKSSQTTHLNSGVTATHVSETRSRSQVQTNIAVPLPRLDVSDSLRKVVNGLALLRLLRS